MTTGEGILGLLTAAVAGNPASVFIEKISTAIEGGLKPWQIRRVATAENTIALAKAENDDKITQIQERAALRVAAEEIRNQRNIEAPIIKALSNIREGARPAEMDDDWLANFFDKCRLVSNEEMQNLWAQVLAGEANVPGSFSPRTVNFLATLNQKEAQLFRRFCSYNWTDNEGIICPIIFLSNDEMPVSITQNELIHLQSIGLITYHYGAFRTGGKTLWVDKANLTYHGKSITAEFVRKENDSHSQPNIYLGGVTLTQLGVELASICDPIVDYGIVDYVINRLVKGGAKSNA